MVSGNGSTSPKAKAAPLTESPSNVDFGNVTLGTSRTQDVTIANTSSVGIVVSQATVSGIDFTVSGLSAPMNLAAGKSSSLKITFAPKTAGSTSGNVTLAINGFSTRASISLKGAGEQPQSQISASPASLVFGAISVGGSALQAITITNRGTSTLKISQVSISGNGFHLDPLPSLPLSIPASQTAQVVVQFAPLVAGSVTGAVTISSNASNENTTAVSLSGDGLAAAATSQLSLSPASLSFGTVSVGSSAQLPLTLSNTGSATLTISSDSVSGTGFSASGPSLPMSLAAGASATLTATFSPASAGSLSGSFTISSNASNLPNATVSLSGTGQTAPAAQLSLSATSLPFGNVTVGSSSQQKLTLSNTGSASLTINSFSVSGSGFSVSGPAAPFAVLVGQSAALTVTYAPSATGSVTGNISISSNSSNLPSATVSLSGSGVAAPAPQITVTPASAAFGSVVTGSNSSQTFLVKNSGNAVLTVNSATLSGTGFSLSGLTSPLSLNAGQSSTFNVVFAPQSAGSVGGSMTLTSNDPVSPSINIPLTGTGIAATFILNASTSAVNFGSVSVSSNSTQTVVLTNGGNSNLNIQSISVSGAGFSATGVTAPVTLTPGQTATLNVSFAPASSGSLTGSIQISSNAIDSPLNITLSGTGMQPVSHSARLNWTASTSVVVGYNVYRAAVSGGPYSKLNASLVTAETYVDSSVLAGQTYFYVVTAVDSSGVESVFSNEATATIPTP